MSRYRHGTDLIPPEEVAADGSVTNDMAQRWTQLQQLQVRAAAGRRGGGEGGYSTQHMTLTWQWAGEIGWVLWFRGTIPPCAAGLLRVVCGAVWCDCMH